MKKIKLYLLNAFSKLRKPQPKLCIVHFVYDLKGVIGSGKNKTESVFAWVQDGCNTHDCLPLFNPPGISKSNCTVREILVTPVQTVIPLPQNHEGK